MNQEIREKQFLDAWQKSKKNLKHKIVNVYWFNGEKVNYYPEVRVVSVNLDNPGLSIVTKDGMNIIIEGGIIKTEIVRPVRIDNKKY